MADYAPHYTPRVRMTYQCQARTHRSIVRLARGSTQTLAVAEAEALYAMLGDFGAVHLYSDWEVLGWDWAPEDQTVFLPIVATTGVIGAVSTTGRPTNQIAMQATIPYRTAAGGHGFFNLYGTNFNIYGVTEQDFRVTGPEDAAVADLVTTLNGRDIVGGDNAVATFKNYMNIGLNARWKRKVRNG